MVEEKDRIRGKWVRAGKSRHTIFTFRIILQVRFERFSFARVLFHRSFLGGFETYVCSENTNKQRDGELVLNYLYSITQSINQGLACSTNINLIIVASLIVSMYAINCK